MLSQKHLSEPRIASLRFFFLFVRNFDNVAEHRLIFLFIFLKLLERGIISFLLSMGRTFQNRYLIENPVFHQNNFVRMLLISLA